MEKLITHNDLDGVSCAILAKLAFGDEVDIAYVSNVEGMDKKLNELFESYEYDQYKHVYVTDCSCDERFFKLIPNIRLFDHHKTALHLNAYSNATVCVERRDGVLTCGTELFYQYLKNHGKISERPFFVEQVRLYDTWDWTKQTYKLPMYLNNLLYIDGISSFVDKMVQRLAKKDVNELTLFDDRDSLLLEYENEILEKYIAQKIEQVRMFEKNGKKVAMVFADRYQSFLGNAICAKYDCDIAAMVDMNKGIMSFRTAKNDIDVSIIAKSAFGGGGHAKSAGATMPADMNATVLKELFENIGNYL